MIWQHYKWYFVGFIVACVVIVFAAKAQGAIIPGKMSVKVIQRDGACTQTSGTIWVEVSGLTPQREFTWVLKYPDSRTYPELPGGNRAFSKPDGTKIIEIICGQAAHGGVDPAGLYRLRISDRPRRIVPSRRDRSITFVYRLYPSAQPDTNDPPTLP